MANIETCVMNKRMILFTSVMLIMSWNLSAPLRRYCEDVQHVVSWCLFPFLMCNFVFLIFFWFGIIYINSDIPFLQSTNMYSVIRMGRRMWIASNIICIIIRSFLAVLLTVICSILPMLRRIELSLSWGRVLHTAAISSVPGEYEFEYFIYYDTLVNNTPLQLMINTFCITSLCAAFLGLLMYAISLFKGRGISVIIATGLSLSLFLVLNTHPKIRYQIARFIPTIWPEVARIGVPEYSYYWLPQIWYMFVALIGIIVILGFVIVLKANRVDLNWNNEDA